MRVATRTKAEDSQETKSFETLYAALEERARRLEQGNLSLEDSLKLYEEGAAVVAELRTVLDAAELRVRTVRGQVDSDDNQFREPEAEYEAFESDE